jgi:signal peptidase I
MGAMRELRLDDDAFAELSAEILRQGGTFQFTAHGSSMTPLIRDGDLLTIAPVDAASLEIGDVALYRTRRDRIIAHRVVGKTTQGGELVLETQGDARLAPDRPVPADCVLGRAVRFQRGDRGYRLDRGPWRLAAHLWIRVLPLRCLATYLVRGVKGVALRSLQAVQSLPPCRRLAHRTIGARALYRPADARDAGDLAKLFGQEALPGIQAPVGAMVRRIVGGEEDGLALIATIGGRPAGCVAVRRFADHDPLYPGWWLLGPVVRARHRRAGLGEELLHLALEKAAAAGATWAHLLAFEGDAATRGLARKVGFLPATLPALQARLEESAGRGGRRRVLLSCALPTRHRRA